MQLDVYPEVTKFVADLEQKRYKQVVGKMFSLLTKPNPQDSSKLKGYEFLRVDIGEYRIVYTYTAQLVTVILVDKRNDDEVYKKLKRNY